MHPSNSNWTAKKFEGIFTVYVQFTNLRVCWKHADNFQENYLGIPRVNKKPVIFSSCTWDWRSHARLLWRKNCDFFPQLVTRRPHKIPIIPCMWHNWRECEDHHHVGPSLLSAVPTPRAGPFLEPEINGLPRDCLT